MMTFTLKPPALRTPILQSLTTIDQMTAALKNSGGSLSFDAIRPLSVNPAPYGAERLVPFIAERMPERRVNSLFAPSVSQLRSDPFGAQTMDIIDFLLPMSEDLDETAEQIYARLGRSAPLMILDGEITFTAAGEIDFESHFAPSPLGMDLIGKRFQLTGDVDVVDVYNRTVTLPRGAQMMVIAVDSREIDDHPTMTLSDGLGLNLTLGYFPFLSLKTNPNVIDLTMIEGIMEAWQLTGSAQIKDITDLRELRTPSFAPSDEMGDLKVIKTNKLGPRDVRSDVLSLLSSSRTAMEFIVTPLGELILLFDEYQLSDINQRLSANEYRDVVSSLVLRELALRGEPRHEAVSAANRVASFFSLGEARALCQQMAFLKAKGYSDEFITNVCIELSSISNFTSEKADLFAQTMIPHVMAHYEDILADGDLLIHEYLANNIARRQFRVRHMLPAARSVDGRLTIITPPAIVTITKLLIRSGDIFAKVRMDSEPLDPDSDIFRQLETQAREIFRNGVGVYAETGHMPREVFDAAFSIAGVEDYDDDDNLVRLQKGEEIEVSLTDLMHAVDRVIREPHLSSLD